MIALNTALEKILQFVCAWLMGLMVVDVTWQVLSRFVMSHPSSFSEELARFLLLWIGFLGGAYAFRKFAHLGLDILTANLKGYVKKLAEGFSDVVSLLFAAILMVFGGAKIMWLTLELEQYSAALQVPMGYVYSVIPLSGVLICLFSLERLIYGRVDTDSSASVNE